MEVEGVRKLILIPQSQYQQLVQNQTRAASSVTSKDKVDEEHNEPGVSHSSDNPGSTAVPDDSASSQNGIVYGSFDDKFGEIEEKILQTIQCSFPRPLMKKMQRLFLFIVSFGSDLTNFTPKGNVVIRGQLLDSNSEHFGCTSGFCYRSVTRSANWSKSFLASSERHQHSIKLFT